MEVLSKHKFQQCCPMPCLKVDQIFIIGRIPLQGYVVADAIPLELRLINESGYRVRRIKVKLCRVSCLLNST